MSGVGSLAQSLVRRWAPPGPRNRPRPAPLGSVASAAQRFSTGLGSPPPIRRLLSGPAPVRPATRTPNVRPPLWWIPWSATEDNGSGRHQSAAGSAVSGPAPAHPQGPAAGGAGTRPEPTVPVRTPKTIANDVAAASGDRPAANRYSPVHQVHQVHRVLRALRVPPTRQVPQTRQVPPRQQRRLPVLAGAGAVGRSARRRYRLVGIACCAGQSALFPPWTVTDPAPPPPPWQARRFPCAVPPRSSSRGR